MIRPVLASVSLALVCSFLAVWRAGPVSADFLAAETALQAGDFMAAAPLLAEEAKLGNPVAAFNLAKIYEDGALGTPDYQAAATYYRVAAEIDTAPRFNGAALGPNAVELIQAAQMFGQFSLGRLYENGQGVPQDIIEAVSWYRRAADLGNVQAQLALALIYRDGRPRLLPDPAQSAAYLRRAADSGSVAAMNELGRAYLKGAGLPPDAREAARWFEKSAALGSREAEYNLGMLFQAGFEGKPDYLRAAEHFERAANKGDGPSMLALGDLYAGGRGVPEDKVEAFAWLKLAGSDFGIGEATHKEAFMAQMLTPAEREAADTRYEILRNRVAAPAPATVAIPATGPEANISGPSESVTTPDLPPLTFEKQETGTEPLPATSPDTAAPEAELSGQPQPGAKPFVPELAAPEGPSAN